MLQLRVLKAIRGGKKNKNKTKPGQNAHTALGNPQLGAQIFTGP